VGKSFTCTYTLMPSDAETTVTWSSANNSIAKVNSSGKVTGVAAGTTDIIATTANGLTGKCTVTVVPKEPDGITVSPSSKTIKVGEKFTCTYTLTPADAETTVTWSSEDSGIASVDPSSGEVTGVAEGTTNIVATTANGITGVCELTVEPKEPDGITVSPSSKTIKVGKSFTCTYTLTPEGAETTVTWSSADKSIAKVNSSGKVTGVAAGTTDIIATTANGLTGKCTVTVVPKEPDGITVSPSSKTIKVGEKFTCTYTLTPSDAETTVTWSSEDSSIASVDPSSGEVTGVAKGTTSIVATTANGITGVCEVTVEPKEPDGITVSPSSKTIKVGKSFTCTYTLMPSDAETTVTWSSANNSIAKVNSSGKVTGVAAGTTDIIATTANGLTDKCTVTVVPKEPEGITVSPSSKTIKVGEKFTCSYTLTPADAETTVTWSSEDSGIATVDPASGEVTGVAKGTTSIVATTANGITGVCEVTVEPKEPDGITVSPSSKTIKVGKSFTCTYTLTPEGAETTVTWSSADESIAKVNSSGKVTGVAAGTTEIIATTANGLADKCTVTVVPKEPEGITVSPSSKTIKVDEKFTCTYTLTPADAETTVTWSSENSDIALVDPASGGVTGVAKGTTSIKATTANGITGVCEVTVEPKDPDGITVSPSSKTIKVGNSFTCTYTLTPEGAETTVTWSSADKSIAKVNSSGKVTGVAAGTTDIIATTANGLTDKCTVTVVPKEPEGVTVSPSSKTIKVDEKFTCTYTLTPADAETTVTWSSEDSGIASVDPASGEVTGVAKGTTSIKATTANGLTDLCMVTVEADTNPEAAMLYVDNFNIKPGEQKTVSVNLDNPGDSFTGCQFDLYLPVGLNIAEKDGFLLVDIGSRSNTRKHTVSASVQSDGSTRIVCYSTNNYTFSGESGEILSITFSAASNAPNGETSMTMRNITLSRPDVTGAELEDHTTIVTIEQNSDDWVEILTNGDMEGTEVVNFYKMEHGDVEPVLAAITDGIGMNGSRAIAVQSTDNAANDWDTQFFVRLPMALPAGTKFRFRFNYKANQDCYVDTQSHAEPGEYIHWLLLGSIHFAKEWQPIEYDGFVVNSDQSHDDKPMQTIAFLLSKNKVATRFVFDNMQFFVERSFYETGVGEVSARQKTAEGIYNLHGQKMDKPGKGLYIVNGRKVLMK
nr:Ig-like domain-containing protein [Prevotella sp.]